MAKYSIRCDDLCAKFEKEVCFKFEEVIAMLL